MLSLCCVVLGLAAGCVKVWPYKYCRKWHKTATNSAPPATNLVFVLPPLPRGISGLVQVLVPLGDFVGQLVLVAGFELRASWRQHIFDVKILKTPAHMTARS